MRILHVIQGLPIAAGTTTFVVNVANEMSRMGHLVTVAISCEPGSNDKCLFASYVRLVSIASIISSVSKESQSFDVVHIHSMWNIWLHRAAVWCRKNGIPYVCSPHGSATYWALHYKWLKKKLAWIMYQRKDFIKAQALHVTVAEESLDMKRLGLKNHIIIAPLGVNVPNVLKTRKENCGRMVFLFVSRVQKKKGLSNLIRAIALLRRNRILSKYGNEPIFRIVGPDQENHVAELKFLAEKCGVSDCLEFIGPKYGADLDKEYYGADVFVLPTLSENFGVVVVDALAHGLPVITTKGAPWQELEEFHCGWWIDIGVEPLVAVLSSVIAMNRGELMSLGDAGRRFVKENYTWESASQKLINGYLQVVDRKLSAEL